jgi:hypothetical protein
MRSLSCSWTLTRLEVDDFLLVLGTGREVTFQDSDDPHLAAGAIKLWLCELQIPLLTYELHDAFMAAIGMLSSRPPCTCTCAWLIGLGRIYRTDQSRRAGIAHHLGCESFTARQPIGVPQDAGNAGCRMSLRPSTTTALRQAIDWRCSDLMCHLARARARARARRSITKVLSTKCPVPIWPLYLHPCSCATKPAISRP